MRRFWLCLMFAFLLVAILPAAAFAQGPTPGQNVNMVSGTTWPFGDPFLERQNEPTIAVSTRNPMHLLAGANDYRSVDLNLPESEVGEPHLLNAARGEPWLGQYISIDGGAHWQSTLLPGYPQDTSMQGVTSPLHCSNWPASCPLGFSTGADPVIASGTNGMFYYAGIAFNRGTSQGVVFVARYMDLNNQENGDISKDTFPIRYINTVALPQGTVVPGQFLDKPSIAVDIPRGAATCNINVPQAGGIVQQTIPAGHIYVAYSKVVTTGGNVTSTIYFTRSTNCGVSWSTPQPISHGYNISQGATIQIDPETGIVYVAWRVIHSGAQQPNDGIAIAASLDGGNRFFPPLTLVSLPPFDPANPAAKAFFDQGTTATSFRTTAYPALAVADSGIAFLPGPLYVAWSQRGMGLNGEAKIMMLAIPGNASFTPGDFDPPTPFAIDSGPITNDVGGIFANLTSGFQIMPSMTFNQGKLMVIYYDLRQDHTIGEFAPSVSNGVFTPDADGNFFEETRDPVAESPTCNVPLYFVSDACLTVRRRTIDLVLAQSNGALVPTFTYSRISHYDFGLFEGQTTGETAPFHQLKFDPPNLPMFMQGLAAFLGDYTGIAGQPFVLVKCGSGQCWTYNNPSPPGIAGTWLAAPKPAPSSPVHYTTWTSNQDVIPPKDGIWDKYTAISNGTSVYDGSTGLSCTPGNEGDRNQNVYFSRITQGLSITSPQTSKPLSSTIQRGFVVLLQNQSSGKSTAAGFVNYFRLSIANQPVNGFASFAQLVPPSPVPSPPFPATNGNGIPFPLTSIDVAIAPHTGAARTIFAVSSNPTASILVNVSEITGLGGTTIAGGLSGFILLNADGTVPANLVDPNGNGPGNPNSISNVELYDPNVSAPNVSAPNVSAPNVSAPNVSAPNVSAPNVSAPNVSAPNVSAPNVSAYGVANPNVSAPNVSAPNVSAAPPSDGTITVTNNSNTNASYNLAVTGQSPTPLQLLLSQIYMTPQTDGNCNLITQQQNITLANVPNVPVVPPDQLTQLSNPNVSAAPVTNATFSLGPGDTAYITLRGNVDIPTMRQILTQVTPVIIPQAINSNNTTSTTPPIFAPLFITTATLPGGVVGTSYRAILSAIGGTAPYTAWNFPSESQPPGLTLTIDEAGHGIISGTPTAAGTFAFTVQVTDSSQPQQTTTRSFSIIVVPPLAIVTTTLPQGVTGFEYATTLQAIGGTPPYSWSSGALPSGLVLNQNTGQISGIPVVAGNSPVRIQVADSGSPAQQVSSVFAIDIASPVTGSGGDFIFRGFYLPSYTGTALVQATLNFSAAVAGDYTITLTAHSGRYDGTVIGSSTAIVTLPADVRTSVPTIFNFPSPAPRVVSGSLVAFTMTLVSGPSQPYFAVSSCALGNTACTTGGPFVETEDTTPPLSVFRRNGVVVTLVSVPAPTISTTATGVSTTPRSGGEALAADLSTGSLFVKSLQDPSGSDLQLARIDQNKAVTILGDFPSVVNSDGSGIAVNPGPGGGIIVADEAVEGGNRIAVIGLSIPPTSGTLFSIPWRMNPAGNGTGQQQYAPILTQVGSGPTHLLLYFWDNTQATLYSVDALASTTFTVLLSLDQGPSAGLHVKTVGNHVVYDSNTATLLLTDGSTNTVLEVNPATSAVSTLFSNLPGVPTSIALSAGATQVFLEIGNSIYVGPRSGGALSLFATGFTSLTNIVLGNATSGNGTSLFAMDKALNTVYEISIPSASATAVSDGGFFSCALLSGGTVKCWGRNLYGQLGNGTNTDSVTPVAVSGLSGATAITTGADHACALLSGGTVECWGYNVDGELGNGTTTTSSNIPVPVAGLNGATAIAAGSFHTCALLSGGTVECWGYNMDGGLGNGTTTNSSTPVAVIGLSGATAVAAGELHTCALLSGGMADCWGLNTFGALGNGTTTNSSTPVAVIGLSGATAIAGGVGHTCALLSGGTVQCWGNNSTYGQLGNGTGTDSSTPVAVSGLSGATAIATGAYHSCALLSGIGQCWGWNGNGQLGNGTTADSHTPAAVSGLSGATTVAAGYAHTCAVLSNGTVQCWGWNGNGQLGNGSTTDSSIPVMVNGLIP